jgi:competence protein ComEA
MKRFSGFVFAILLASILWRAIPAVEVATAQTAQTPAATVVLPPPDQTQQDAIVKQLPPGPGKDILVNTCSGCHLLSVVTVQRKTEDQWTDSVIEMRGRGAQASDDDLVTLVAYLAKNFGPESAPARVNINNASAIEIAGALGISQEQANAIVDYRAKHGKFKDAEAVKQVPAVDAAKIDAAKAQLDF